ncbi:hypothetical protein FFL01_26120 [Flavobacterium flevense]|uniref:DUF4142 domain-containing protein n=2 Tax=Flavobacterium flevense TaxID=983 RepID=A0A4Y4B332_9FLAO|nr:hypothetical protein FFL01_26120 [Flavobacterium flevense]
MLASCEKKNKTEKDIPEMRIIPQTLIEIAESNLKVVAITQKAQESTMENSTQLLFKKIEFEHLELKKEIRKIAKDNFIIIPNTLYDTNTLKSFISEANIKLYLNRTSILLRVELDQYKRISKTTPNDQLKNLADKTIVKLEKNINILQKEAKTIK